MPLIVVGLALAPIWATALAGGARGHACIGAAIAAALEILLIVGIAVPRSPAGVLIGIGVLLAATSITATSAPAGGVRRAGLALPVAALIGTAVVGLCARTALVERFQAPIGAELRLQTAPTVRRVAETFFPFGAGLGSFDGVFRAAEPLSAVTATYFNHAHAGAMELLVETGAFGMVVLMAFAAWWVWLTV